MKTWLRLFVILLNVGGGFTGVVVTLQYLLGPKATNPLVAGMAFGALMAYGFIVYTGLTLVVRPRCSLPLFVAFALQVPWISSPFFSYRMTAGGHLTLGWAGGINWGARLGSDWQMMLLGGNSWGGGLNLLAVVMLILLVRVVEAEDAPAPNAVATTAPPKPNNPEA